MTILECANDGCSECRESVKKAHRFENDKPKLHGPAPHCPSDSCRPVPCCGRCATHDTCIGCSDADDTMSLTDIAESKGHPVSYWDGVEDDDIRF